MSALKTPSFWYRPPLQDAGLGERMLEPAAQLYEFLYHWHQQSKKPYIASIPVVCIGNIVAGGTGKTPTALALMNLLRDMNAAKNPFFLLRGYGGSERGPVQVDPLMHSAWEVGDEALILNKHAPTIVAADRAAGVQFAQRRGADLILMDDGLQNPGLHKDIKFVVINGEMGFGNRKLIPAGPLRQPLDEGIAAADGFILIGNDERDVLNILPPEKPVFKATLTPSANTVDTTQKYLAFAGLGYPEKFFNFLRGACGLTLVDTISFADHCPYQLKELEDLQRKAEALNAHLITTEKDALRIPELPHIPIAIMPVEMSFKEPHALRSYLERRLAHKNTLAA